MLTWFYDANAVTKPQWFNSQQPNRHDIVHTQQEHKCCGMWRLCSSRCIRIFGCVQITTALKLELHRHFLCEMDYSPTKILACTGSPFLVIFDNIPHLLCNVRQSLSSRPWSQGTSLSLFSKCGTRQYFLQSCCKNYAWVTVNSDFWSRVRWFAHDFHEWRSHDWKSLAYRITSSQTIVIHGNEWNILFLSHYSMTWTHNSAKKIIDRSFPHCRQGRTFLS